jgi:F-type H+-transporting ATPase subunit b
MKIDWFTVIAQVVNFLVLVLLLKKFLYKPILDAITARESKITDRLKDADNKKSEAKKEEDEFKRKNEEFDRQKKEMMDKALSEANAGKQRVLDEAKAEAGTLKSNMEKAAEEKRENDRLDFAQQTQKQVFAITRKALAEIASISLEEQSANTFIQHVNELKDDDKKQFIDAFKSNSNTILVRSAFELPAKQQGEINDAIDAILDTKAKLQFKKSPDMISGVELSTNGYKMSWSFLEYINSLEKHVSEKVNQKAAPQTQTNEHAAT